MSDGLRLDKVVAVVQHRLHVHVVPGEGVGLGHREVVALILAIKTGKRSRFGNREENGDSNKTA